MPSKKNKIQVLPDRTYHIYNRGNNFGRVFFCKEDYKLFLKTIKKYLSPIADIYAYALINNHFHLVVHVRNEPNIKFATGYSKCILRYTNIINYNHKRSGSLFLNPYKRIEITNEEYLRRLVFYVHHNPEKHKIVENYRVYPFSSYQAFMSNKPTNIDREYVLKIYGSKDEFLEYHNYLSNLKDIGKLSLED